MRERTIDFVAGGVSGLISDFATHPVDTVRVRLWMQGSSSSGGYRYRGLWHGFCDIAQKEGVRSIFKGFGSVALLTPVGYGLYFGSYEWAKTTLQAKTPWSDGAVHLTAGFFANGVADFAWNPMEVVKQREQAVVGRMYSGPFQGLQQLWKEGRLRKGLLRGYWSNMATYGPFSALYFFIYENWKTRWTQHLKCTEDELSGAHFICGGAFAGAISAAATSPIDLVKTRIQVDNSYGGGIANTAVRIWREEGAAVITKGMWARVMWIAPGTALTMLAYEESKRLLSSLLPAADSEALASAPSSLAPPPPPLIQ